MFDSTATRVYITTGPDRMHRVTTEAPANPTLPVVSLVVYGGGSLEVPAEPLTIEQLDAWWGGILARVGVTVYLGEPAK